MGFNEILQSFEILDFNPWKLLHFFASIHFVVVLCLSVTWQTLLSCACMIDSFIKLLPAKGVALFLLDSGYTSHWNPMTFFFNLCIFLFFGHQYSPYNDQLQTDQYLSLNKHTGLTLYFLKLRYDALVNMP